MIRLSRSSDQSSFGGGCFWCLEAAYQQIAGVTAVTSGYAGGTEADPTYELVGSGRTDHAEVVKVEKQDGKPVVVVCTVGEQPRRTILEKRAVR